MNTKMPVFLVLSLAVAYVIISGSGYGALIGGTPADHSPAAGEIEENVNERQNSTESGAPEQSGGVRGSDDSDIVSMIISGGQNIASFLKFLAYLPAELERLDPIPGYVAWPIGVLLQMVGAIGLWQFSSGRTYE